MSLIAGIGIDAGSTTCKLVAVDAAGNIVASRLEQAHPRIEVQVEEMLEWLRSRHGAAQGLPCVATGYGRKLVQCADRRVTEITCHARGVFRDLQRSGTLVDIGGQDSKVIRIGDDGRPIDFVMNTRRGVSEWRSTPWANVCWPTAPKSRSPRRARCSRSRRSSH
jgi:activator of 2-hydroxyglutaryl-CoA dehydratase